MAYAKEKRELDLSRPVTVWRSQDLLDGRPVESLTMILRTVGCRWNRCTMCGYAGEGAPASAHDLIAQFECAMETILARGVCGQDLYQRQLPGSG